MNDRKQRRLDLLGRLREMRVEEARADHVASQTELEQRREQADDTERRIQTLDVWVLEKLTGGGVPLVPELLRHAELFRGVEKRTLEGERAEEAASRERTEAARTELTARFEELSAIERLSVRHSRAVENEQIRTGFIALDEAGIRKTLEAKE